MGSTGSTAATRSEDWDIVLVPRQEWWRIDLKEFWHYRDLVRLMAHRDITAQYKQTVLGPLWHVIQPLTTTFTFAFIFGKAAGLSPPDVPAILFYLSGIVSWNYFAGVINRTSKTFVGGANVMSKVYFPRLVVPVSMTLSSLVSYLIQLATFLLFYFTYWVKGPVKWHLSPWVAAMPLLILMMAALGLGVGVLVSSMTTKYRDLSFLVGFGVQLLMYASPVIMPLDRLAKVPWLLRIFKLNPMTPVIEATRAIFFGKPIDWAGLGYTAVVTAVVVGVGLMVFHRVERSFADIV
ncbi:MAG: ABC transporter permease [Flavobacteriales bacterium]|nr:ABC transporter permease [Flavobacteriales bacterium]MCB9193644.1 ABC transporter permease [Flavobacteriales bacterium]